MSDPYVWKFNPYTGTARHQADIASDPYGRAIVPAGTPLRSATPSEGLLALLGTFKSHIDGRDLLDELHPRSEIDIRVRRDGQCFWYEGDWLSNVRDARNSIMNGLCAVKDKS